MTCATKSRSCVILRSTFDQQSKTASGVARQSTSLRRHSNTTPTWPVPLPKPVQSNRVTPSTPDRPYATSASRRQCRPKKGRSNCVCTQLAPTSTEKGSRIAHRGGTTRIATVRPGVICTVRGRYSVFGNIPGQLAKDPNYPLWCAGADSSTTLHTEADLKIGNLTVPKGDYSLYVDLKDVDHWQLIVNKATGQWGLTYDKSQDLGRVPMTMSKPAAPVEVLKYTITSSGNKGKITLEWENYSGSVDIEGK